MMGNVIGMANNLSGLTLSNGLETFFKVIFANYRDTTFPILKFFVTLIYTIFKWVLTVIDFCFLLVRQLCGINTDFSSLDSVVEGDVIFQFIFSESVMKILQGLFMLAIVVIIILGIIAIIKSEYMAIADVNSTGEIKNSKAKVWKSIFESCMLLILVPVVTFAGIILSNAVLQTLYNATVSKNNQTIGSQIFVASSYDANAYRNYANGNKKIPITYNFNQIKDYSAVTDWDTTGTMEEVSNALSQYKRASEWNQGYATFEMFYMQSFFAMSDIDYMQQTATAKDNVYNAAYDTGLITYSYEYLVNADLQDYLMQSGKRVYVMTAEEAYQSSLAAGHALNMTKTEHGDLTFSVNYNDGKDAIVYTHKKGATDEAKGAVFLICEEQSYTQNNLTKYYYKPLAMGNRGFSTSYLNGADNYIVARGQFDEGTYPTAIKKVDGEVTYYREKLNVPTMGSFFPHISYDPPEGVTSTAGAVKVLGEAIEFITGVDISKFIPTIYFDIDILNLFSKSEKTVAKLADSSYYLDYSFTGSGVSLGNLYFQLKINLIILVLASVLILPKLVHAFFGIIKRTVNIMFLYLVYPAAVSTIPLYGKSNFGTWVKQMFQKVVSMYGLVIGLNLALLLIPLSSSINLITPAMLNLSGSFGAWTAKHLNILIQLLFILVGINFIFEVPKFIDFFVQADKDIKKPGDAVSVVDDGKKVIEESTKVYKKAYDVYTGQSLIKAAKGVLDYVPGSAIPNEIAKRKDAKGNMQRADKIGTDAKETFEADKQKALADAAAKKAAKSSNNANSNAEAGNNAGGQNGGGSDGAQGGNT